MLLLILLILFLILVASIFYLIKNPNCLLSTKNTTKTNEATLAALDTKLPTNGELYQAEPCKDGLISDNGICKLKPGSSCIMTSDCTHDYACFFGTCTQKPKTWDECYITTCNDGLVCIDHHLMQLVNNKFIMLSGWWLLRGCLDICDSPISNTVYILKEDGLFTVSIDSSSSIRQLTALHINSSYIIRIFLFREALHALAKDGKIYRGLTNRELLRFANWEWSPIEFIYGRDISDEFIIDIITSSDGILSLYCLDSRRLTYNGNVWYEDIILPFKISPSSSSSSRDHFYKPSSRIIYGSSRHNYINLSRDLLSLYHNNNQLFTIDKVKDCVFDPSNDLSIIIITNNDIIKRLSFIDDSLSEEVINGSGKYLRVAHKCIWLLTSHTCVRV